MTELPSHARAVVIGGGIAGCSIAYHLNKLGWRDVVLLEQGRLSGGTTWHAAGLVGQLRTHPSMTRLIRYSTSLYAALEAETGQATGWKQCGSLTVARTEERMTLLRRVAASARVQGVDCELLTAAEAGKRFPIMETKDLVGGIWLPGDGKANPADITQALAKGARAGGTRIFEKTRVAEIVVKDGVARGVRTASGDITADVVVIACGQWSRQLAATIGVTVPLHSCEHMYIVTGRIDGVTPDLPCLRDPDGYIYFKEEVGGLLMGGFEPTAKPWKTQVPDDFEFGLLPDDWDQFEILMKHAIERVPALETAEVKRFLNGPESFTADNNYILGESPDVRGLYVAAGFNSMGIASSGGAGKALAEWIVEGSPTLDLWPVDIRRFAAFNGNRIWMKDRVAEVLGLHYKMPWPARELESARPLRRSPLYDRLAAKGAIFGSKMGWERPNVFAPKGEARELGYSWGRANWFPWHVAEQKAARSTAVIFDMTSFAKLMVQGRDAEAQMQRLAANDVAVPVGRSVYTGLINARGGYESDVTVARLSRDEFLVLTGTAQATRDADWIRRNIDESARATVTDVTSAMSVLALMGPKAGEVMHRAGCSGHERLAFGDLARVEIGFATAYACRRTYVGEAGFELYVPSEFTAAAYDRLMEAGATLGIADAGYYALEAMRVEKGYRAWGRELNPDTTPYEAGLAFAVKLGKSTDFIGKTALLEAKATPPRRRCVSLVARPHDAPLLHGGELVLRDGKPVGEVTSAAFGAALDRPVMLAYVATDGVPLTREALARSTYTVDVGGITVPVTASLEAPFDPGNARLKA